MSEADIAKIVETYRNFETVEKYAYHATANEIRENDFNLNTTRHTNTFENEEEIASAARGDFNGNRYSFQAAAELSSESESLNAIKSLNVQLKTLRNALYLHEEANENIYINYVRILKTELMIIYEN